MWSSNLRDFILKECNMLINIGVWIINIAVIVN